MKEFKIPKELQDAIIHDKHYIKEEWEQKLKNMSVNEAVQKGFERDCVELCSQLATFNTLWGIPLKLAIDYKDNEESK